MNCEFPVQIKIKARHVLQIFEVKLKGEAGFASDLADSLSACHCLCLCFCLCLCNDFADRDF